MPKGLSIHIGLNRVDPDHYAGWSGELTACEFDAKDMEAMSRANDFQPTVFLSEEASADAVTGAISAAATELGSDDILFLTYSGHGGQVPDANSDEQDDRKDETWCLFDRQLVDDELYTLWSQFQPGVRIFVLSDSCHSGSAVRDTVELIPAERLAAAGSEEAGAQPRFKVLPESKQGKVYEQNQSVYDAIQARTTANDKTDISPYVLLISGCQDSQTSADGERNGLFTQALRQVWDDGTSRAAI